MVASSRIKVEVDMANSHGKYTSHIREFNDEKHLENWEKYMHKVSPHKIVGIKRLTDEG